MELEQGSGVQTCRTCGHVWNAEAAFCGKCGASLTANAGEPVGRFLGAPSASREWVQSAPAAVQSDNLPTNVVIAVLGAMGIVVGTLLSWTREISISSLDLPVGMLFKADNFQSNQPRIGHILLVSAALGLAAGLARAAWLYRIAALLAGGTTFLYLFRIVDNLSGSGSSFIDVLGPGFYVTLISAALLLAAPSSRHKIRRPSDAISEITW